MNQNLNYDLTDPNPTPNINKELKHKKIFEHQLKPETNKNWFTQHENTKMGIGKIESITSKWLRRIFFVILLFIFVILFVAGISYSIYINRKEEDFEEEINKLQCNCKQCKNNKISHPLPSNSY